MASIAVIPGDGIGAEVTAEVLRLLELLRGEGLPLSWRTFDYCADRYLATGVALPPGGREELASFDAIFLGALGDPRVPDMAHAREILLETRFRLDLFVNVRPVRLLHASHTPLKDRTERDIDFVIFRENTEGPYVGAGGFLKPGTPDEVAIQEWVATRKGVERILRHAFEAARRRPRHRLVMVDKHNALRFASEIWHRVFREVAKEYPDVEARHLFADTACLLLVQDPSQFEVIVTDNLFGDLLSDLGAALAGGLGLAPSASLNPQTGKGLFEPVHGSAPGIAGTGRANPMAALLTAAMMLEFLGQGEAAARVERAVRACIAEELVTPDLGGGLTTRAVGQAVLDRISKGAA